MEDFPISKLDQSILDSYFGEIPNPPKQLFVRGNFPIDQHLVFLTVVGSRNHSIYGKNACEHLIKGLKGYPIVIVSGLAFGIDAIAHESALDAGLLTMGIPGSGLGKNALYPKAHFDLGKRILEQGGCLVSEYPEHTAGQTWTFPERNRLMAGISRATLIVEATHKSGSRITTKLATEYNRDVLAVPGSIFSEMSEAPNELIRMGAIPVTSPQEILEALGFAVTETAPMDLFSQCTEEEAFVLRLLASPKRHGDLIREMDIPTHKANVLLMQMEIKGLIKENGGEVRRA
ncbi:MAG: hypothetical protein JWM20_211 [Patescibacteria group bacterium]|nr:hypothetical protein [Patescibacteria group bacterium]